MLWTGPPLQHMIGRAIHDNQIQLAPKHTKRFMNSNEMPLTAAEKVHQALLLQWVKGAWLASDAIAVEDHFHPECVVTGMTPEVLEGVEQVRAAHNAICGRLNHTSADVSMLLIRGDEYSGYIEIEAIHRDSGTSFAFEVASFGRMKDGLIHRCHNVIDHTGMYAKLGVMDVAKLSEMMS